MCAALLGALLHGVRPWYLGWGATPEERARALPGDGLSAGPRETRAIDVAAPADQVFAWVSQLGQDRAGFYSYTALQNLVGCEMPDVRHLDPALQRWELGDRLWMYPRDELGGVGYATLLQHEPGRALVFGTHARSDAPGAPPTGTWAFVVEATSERSARLLTRSSGAGARTGLGQAFTRAVFEPLHFAMERRMLEGIRGLAEGRPIARATDLAQLACWGATSVLFFTSGVLVLLGSRPWRRLAGFVAAGVVFPLLTLVQPSPVVGALLVVGLAGIIGPVRRGAARSVSDRVEPAS